MRFSKWFLGIAGVGAIATSGLVGCGGTSSGNTGGTGGTSSASTGKGSTSATMGTGASTSPSSTGTSMTEPCTPHSSCPSPAPALGCIGLTDNTGKTKFGLRMSELDVTKPTALSKGIVASTIAGAVTQDEAACNLSGTATFNWLLQFDTTAGTLTTGGAKPVTDPTAGYSFDTDMVMGNDLSPVVVDVKPDASGNFAFTMGQDLVVPIFLDAAATQVVLLPLKGATIQGGKLTDGNNCIGSYNAATLDPSSSCQPDASHPAFTDGAALDGYIKLSDANTVIISALSESLCAFLASADQADLTSMNGVTVCKTDTMGNPLFKGDWCSTTNTAGGCQDSQQLTANFAASSVIIK